MCKQSPKDDILSEVGGLYFVVTPMVQLTVVGLTIGKTLCCERIVCTQKFVSTILQGSFSPKIKQDVHVQ